MSVAKSDAFADDKSVPRNKKMLNEAVQYAVFSPFHPKWREIEEKYIRPQLDLVFNGKKSAAEVAKELAPEVNAQLKRDE